MPLSIGAVSIADNHAVTKSGLAGRVYELVVLLAAKMGGSIPEDANGLVLKRAQADFALVLATVLFNVLTIDARAKISSEASGLQRIPSSTALNTNCNPPGVDKFLPIV
jgi:hypothetical protein